MIALPDTPEGILARVGGGALLVDKSGTVLFANKEACHLLKYPVDGLEGLSIERLIPERFRPTHVDQRVRFMDDRRRRLLGSSLLALCKDGSELQVTVSLHPVQRDLQAVVLVTIQPRAPER